jgi:hypothetical protein
MPSSLFDAKPFDLIGVPDGIRTRVTAVKGRCPRPLDDGDLRRRLQTTPRRRSNRNKAWGSCQKIDRPVKSPREEEPLSPQNHALREQGAKQLKRADYAVLSPGIYLY